MPVPPPRDRRKRRAPPRHPTHAARRSPTAGVEGLETRVLLSTYSVSPGGSDSGLGSIDAPFRTIQEAANVAGPGDAVLIHAGTYHETVTPPRSGSLGAPITFAPAGDGPVTIDGADPVGGWTSASGAGGRIYQTTLPWDLGTGNNQILVDGVAMTEARWPDVGPNPARPVTEKMGNVSITPGPGGAMSIATMSDPNLKIAAGAWDGATIHFNPGQQWSAQTGTVIHSGPGSLTFSFLPRTNGGVYTAPAAGSTYFLTGGPAGLTSAGEWYRDPATARIKLWSPSGANPAGHVEAKARPFAFNLSGRSYITVQGINLLAASITSDSRSSHLILSGLKSTYASHFDVFPDGWEPPYNSGIYLAGTDSVIQNSTVAYTDGNGIYLAGEGNRAVNDTVHHADLNGMDGAGIRVEGGDQVVYHCSVYTTGRSGIVFSDATRAHILNNLVHDVMLQTTDGGGIYGYHVDGQGTEVAYNTVYNATSGGYRAAGLYLDNFSKNVVVDHNVTWNVDFGLKMNSPSHNNRIYNNTLLGYQASVVGDHAFDMAGSTFVNNIFRNAAAIGSGASQNHNLFSGTNPQFANPGANNYQLTAGSPARDKGAILPPFTNGFAGAAPDIGAYEYGALLWSSGTSGASYPAPSPPAWAAASDGPAGVRVTWDATSSTGSVGFNVYRGGDPAGPFVKVNGAPVSAATAGALLDTAAPAGGTEFYRVVAVDARGDESFAAVASVNRPRGPLPTPAVTVRSGGASATVVAGRVDLAWPGAAGVVGYVIDRYGSEDGQWEAVASTPPGVTFVSDTIDAIDPGTFCIYRIRALYPGGSSATLAPLSVTPPPAPPTNVVAAANAGASGASVKLTWSAATGATGYTLQRSPNGAGNWTTVGATHGQGATAFTDTTLATGTTVYYQVIATNASGATASGNLGAAMAASSPTPTPTPTPVPTRTPTPTPTPTPAPGSVSLAPTDDAYVRDGAYAASNFGGDSQLLVKSATANGGYVRAAYLRFDLTGIAGAGPITSARLQLFGAEVAGGAEPSVTLSAYAPANSDWSQGSITYANAPSVSGSPVASAVVAGATPRLYSFDLTRYLQQQQAQGRTAVTIAVTGTAFTTGIVAFNSTESGVNMPALLVSTGG